MRLTHVRLLVGDYASCFRFYRDVLGLELAFGDEDGPYADFRAGSAALALFDRAGQAEVVDVRAPGDGALVVFAVDDVDSAVERLREHVVDGPVNRADWGLRVAYVRDPDGSLIEINEPIPMEE